MELTSTVIACYNNLDTLKITLPEWKYQDWNNYEVIVVDDGSPVDSGIKEYVESLGYRYYRQRRGGWGFYRACNYGVWVARGKRVIIIGSDMIPLPNVISGHMEAGYGDVLTAGQIHKTTLSATGNEVNMKGVVKYPESYSTNASGREFHYRKDHRRAMKKTKCNPMSWNTFWAGNVSIPRSKFIEINGFDETSELHDRIVGELDLSRRFRRLGIPVISAVHSEGIHISHKTVRSKATRERLLARDNDPIVNIKRPESWI